VTLSDYKDRSFGMNYGVLMKENGLLARTVFIVDSDDVVRYIQRVSEMGQEPDYEAVLRALDEIRSAPAQ